MTESGKTTSRVPLRYRSFFDGMHDPACILTTDWVITTVNDAAATYMGYGKEEMSGMAMTQLVTDERTYRFITETLSRTDYIRDYPVRVRGKDGRDRESSVTIWSGGACDGNEVYYAIMRDVTRQRQAESAAFYSTLAERSQAGVYVVQEGIFRFVNPHIQAYSGYGEDELVGMASLDIVHPDDREATRQNAINMLKGKRNTPYEYRLITKDNRITWIMESVTSIDYFGEPAVLGNSMNITAFMETKTRLQEMETLESSILAAIPHAVIGLENRQIIFANDAVQSVFGWKPEEILGRKTRFFYNSDEDYQEIGHRFYPTLEKQSTFSMEFPCLKKDGKPITCFISASRVGHSLTNRRIVVVYQDISERKNAEAAVRESEEKYAAVVEQAVYGVVIIQDTRYTFANRAMAGMTGYSVGELVGMDYRDLFTANSRVLIERRYGDQREDGRVMPPFELQVKKKNGEVIDADIAFGRIHILGETAYMGYVRDITERKKAQKELKRTVHRLRKRLKETVAALASMTEKRDPYTAGHQERVRELARAIAVEMKLPLEQREGLLIAATLHDIGKIYEPAEILSKPDILTDIEYLMMKVHPSIGYDILKNIDFPWPVAEIVYQHHERIDGSGYPMGLKGNDILIEARILAVADVVEAMASHRPYRSSRGIEAALAEITENRGILYEEKVVDACVKLFREKQYSFEDQSA